MLERSDGFRFVILLIDGSGDMSNSLAAVLFADYHVELMTQNDDRFQTPQNLQRLCLP